VRPAIVVILGYPGTGKFTVATELMRIAEDRSPTRLIDNHAAANLLFNLISEADGRSALPPKVLENVREINLIVVRTIEELSPPDWSFVFTHHFQDNDWNRSYLGRLQALAARRVSTFLPVILTCDQDVLLERVARPGRRARRKLVDPSIALGIMKRGMLVAPESLTIDTTLREPIETAEIIWGELIQRSLE
jgi:hypothetical protein